jgi:nucleotide-binding universal stress UspA family protein
MKTILLLAHDDAGQEARLQVALDVTRALGGHLTCLDVIVPPVALAYNDYSGFTTEALMNDERDREGANRSRLEARLAGEDVAWSWHETTGFREEAIEKAAGLADLVVLSSRLGEKEPSEIRQLAGHVVEKADCPVLAVPSHAKGLDLTGNVLIAWDGSREADDALRHAVPLLRIAGEVVLFVLDADEGAFAAELAAEYLSRQGVHARIATGHRKSGDLVYSEILDQARAVSAAYIVMGAYGHSPVMETVFGGVTRSMLAQSDVPLLLAH